MVYFFIDFLILSGTCICRLLDDQANQSSYEELRVAVMEYWVLMKEYYKAVSIALVLPTFALTVPHAFYEPYLEK